MTAPEQAPPAPVRSNKADLAWTTGLRFVLAVVVLA